MTESSLQKEFNGTLLHFPQKTVDFGSFSPCAVTRLYGMTPVYVNSSGTTLSTQSLHERTHGPFVIDPRNEVISLRLGETDRCLHFGGTLYWSVLEGRCYLFFLKGGHGDALEIMRCGRTWGRP